MPVVESSVCVALVAAAGLLVALLGWRFLPAGTTAGLFAAGVSMLLAIYVLADRTREWHTWYVRATAMWIALALIWYLAATWVERSSKVPALADRDEQPADASRNARQQARRLIGLQTAAVAGLLALGTVWVRREAPYSEADLRPLWVLLVALALLGAVAAWRLRAAIALWGSFASLATMLCLLVSFDVDWPAPAATAAYQICVAAVLLGSVVVSVLREWRARVRIARTAPGELVRETSRSRRPGWITVCVALFLLLLNLPLMADASSPITLAILALTILAVGHNRGSTAIGELGLAVTSLAIASLGAAWLSAGPLGWLLGWTLAAGYPLWLARFWQQQLHDGRPWTTAGRLVPAARRLAVVATCAAFVCAWTLVNAYPRIALPTVAAPVSIAALVVLAFMHVRDANIGSATAAWAAGLAITAALAPLRLMLGPQHADDAWPTLVAGAGLLLTLRVIMTRHEPTAECTFDALLTGVLPLAVVALVAGSIGAILPPIGLLLAALTIYSLRRSSRRSPAAGDQAPVHP